MCTRACPCTERSGAAERRTRIARIETCKVEQAPRSQLSNPLRRGSSRPIRSEITPTRYIPCTENAEQSAVAQGTGSPRPALSNSDLEQRARTAYLNALTALKRVRKSFERTDGTSISLKFILSGMGNTAAGQTSLCESIGGTGACLSGSFERSGAHWRQRAGLSGHFERIGDAEASQNGAFERSSSTRAGPGQA